MISKEELKTQVSKILSEKVINVGIRYLTGRLDFVEVSEASFENLTKLNEKYPIELIEGYDTDNITIFFK